MFEEPDPDKQLTPSPSFVNHFQGHYSSKQRIQPWSDQPQYTPLTLFPSPSSSSKLRLKTKTSTTLYFNNQFHPRYARKDQRLIEKEQNRRVIRREKSCFTSSAIFIKNNPSEGERHDKKISIESPLQRGHFKGGMSMLEKARITTGNSHNSTAKHDKVTKPGQATGSINSTSNNLSDNHLSLKSKLIQGGQECFKDKFFGKKGSRTKQMQEQKLKYGRRDNEQINQIRNNIRNIEYPCKTQFFEWTPFAKTVKSNNNFFQKVSLLSPSSSPCQSISKGKIKDTHSSLHTNLSRSNPIKYIQMKGSVNTDLLIERKIFLMNHSKPRQEQPRMSFKKIGNIVSYQRCY